MILLVPLSNLKELLLHDFGEGVLIPDYITEIEYSLAIIRRSNLLISPDTLAVHAASNYNIMQIAVYLSSKQAFREWNPNSNNAEVIFAEDKVDNVDLEGLRVLISKVS